MKFPSALSSILGPLRELLSFGKKPFLAVDIGLSAVKIAEMDCKFNEKKFTLLNYVSVPLPEGAIIEDEVQKEDEIVEAIKEGLDQLGVGPGASCCIALSGPNTVAKKLQLSGGSEEEIEDQVIWESEQYLPFDIEESTVGFDIIGENEGGGVDVIVGAAKNDVILNFKELVEKSSLKVKVIDLGILAVTNMFELAIRDKEVNVEESFLILDIGAQKTSFIIYRNERVLFAKEINVGGVMITEEIQRQLGVNYYEAEDLKVTGDENGNLPEEIIEIMSDVVEGFFSEIKKTLDFYVSSTSDESLAACAVTGGSSLISGLLEGLEALIGVQVSILNPFDFISYNEKKIDADEIHNITYKGVQVLGLSMRRET